MTAAGQSFELSDVFEDMVDWPKRLAGEEPFYRRLFESADARTILDAACGTGQHAALFHSWGMRVEGADISPRMIERARALHGEPEGLSWTVRGFDEEVPAGRLFDVVLCVGNSLAMSPDRETAGKAVEAMTAALRPGGVLALHLQNIWRFAEGPCVWQKCIKAVRPEGEAIIVKGVHRCGEAAHVELLIVPVSSPAGMKSARIPLLCLEASELEGMLRTGGASRVELFGGYQGQPYERDKSVDLVAVVRR